MLTLISSILLTTTTKPYGRATNQNGNTFYYVTNYRGDVVRMVDENGATVANYSYDPWGKVLSVSENAAVAGQPLGYAGYYYDRETKLYYLQARYYDPETARFISRDPDPGDKDDPITQNAYTYANNNPVIYVDPDGNNPVLIAAAVQIIRQVATRIGPRVALAAYTVLKPWLKKVRGEAKKYSIRVSGPNSKSFKFQIAIIKKGVSKPVFRLEYHYERGKWELHYHVGDKRVVLWTKD
ncbi:RHS repeat-associated core domain-containing protein [Anoxybacteroides rupiense]|uniref:RHS repeat-associated core domain-containing protein n=1 Tax=Anoxybacteroides rupiense TaxID=311460 RepID=UPI001F095B6B|nr:RHS repeat-associated core domain-containing protein [Anoxybacillus rupiensis]